MSTRRSWAEIRAEAMASPETRDAYEETRIAHELGAAVRARRLELGLSQAQLAKRAGLRQPAVARFEAGGTTPTIPMLERLASALGMRLDIGFRPLNATG